MTYTVEDLEKQIEKEMELAVAWREKDFSRERGTFGIGPHHREVERLQVILSLVKLGVDLIEVSNGVAFINSPKGKVVQYSLRKGKWRLPKDRVWLGSRSPKIFVEKFLSQE